MSRCVAINLGCSCLMTRPNPKLLTWPVRQTKRGLGTRLKRMVHKAGLIPRPHRRRCECEANPKLTQGLRPGKNIVSRVLLFSKKFGLDVPDCFLVKVLRMKYHNYSSLPLLPLTVASSTGRFTSLAHWLTFPLTSPWMRDLFQPLWPEKMPRCDHVSL